MGQITVFFTHEELGELQVEVATEYPAGHQAGIGWNIQSVTVAETEVDYDPDSFLAYLEKSGRYDEFDELVRNDAD